MSKDTVVFLPDGSYRVSSGPTSIVVSPSEGGRITSFMQTGYDFLADKKIHPENYGSTFWPSPQSIWNWPPPPVLDNQPYSAAVDGDTIVLNGGSDPVTGLRFTKKIFPDGNGRMTIVYSMANTADTAIHVAPWEVTRVHKGGVLFFPLGEGSVVNKNFGPVPAEVTDGIVWYKDSVARPAENELSVADGSEGWMAYAIDGRLFVKKFADVRRADQAPGEAEVSVYVSAVADYIEIETQGSYSSISRGNQVSWRMNWIAADIPSGISVSSGNMRLVDFARNVAGK